MTQLEQSVKDFEAGLKSANGIIRYNTINKIVAASRADAVFAPEAFELLRRVADGSRRAGLRWYDYHDQACALNALLDLNIPQATDYVNDFFGTHQRVYSTDRMGRDSFPYANPDVVTIQALNAKGDFCRRLITGDEIALQYRKNILDRVAPFEVQL